MSLLVFHLSHKAKNCEIKNIILPFGTILITIAKNGECYPKQREEVTPAAN